MLLNSQTHIETERQVTTAHDQEGNMVGELLIALPKVAELNRRCKTTRTQAHHMLDDTDLLTTIMITMIIVITTGILLRIHTKMNTMTKIEIMELSMTEMNIMDTTLTQIPTKMWKGV